MTQGAGLFAVVVIFTSPSTELVTAETWERPLTAALEGFATAPELPREAGAAVRLAEALAACGLEAGCLGTRLEAAGVELGLVLTAELELAEPLASLLLVRASDRRILGRAVLRVERDGPAAIQVAAERLLAQAGLPAAGRLLLSLDPPGAELELVAPVPSTRLASGAHKLAVGRYRGAARLAGHAPAPVDFEITPAATTRVEARLEAESGLLGSAWFWGAVGLAAAGAIIAVAAVHSQEVRSFCLADREGICD